MILLGMVANLALLPEGHFEKKKLTKTSNTETFCNHGAKKSHTLRKTVSAIWSKIQLTGPKHCCGRKLWDESINLKSVKDFERIYLGPLAKNFEQVCQNWILTVKRNFFGEKFEANIWNYQISRAKNGNVSDLEHFFSTETWQLHFTYPHELFG